MRAVALLVAGVAIVVIAFVWWNRDEAPAPASPPVSAAAPATPPAPVVAPAQPPAPVAEDHVVVRFEDGTAMPIRVGFVWPLPPPVNAGLPARERYATLRPLADAGDAVAARALYELLDRCRKAAMPPDCAGISAEQTTESHDWLLRAARGGDYLAGQEWATTLGDTQEGFDAWEARWRQGDPVALQALSRLYDAGVPASTGGTPDATRAHAYRIVDFHVREAVYGQFKGLGSTQLRRSESVRAAGGRLNPQQHAEALALAKEILAGNPNCCRGIW
jgi:hypothetical protein